MSALWFSFSPLLLPIFRSVALRYACTHAWHSTERRHCDSVSWAMSSHICFSAVVVLFHYWRVSRVLVDACACVVFSVIYLCATGGFCQVDSSALVSPFLSLFFKDWSLHYRLGITVQFPMSVVLGWPWTTVRQPATNGSSITTDNSDNSFDDY